MCIRDSGVTVIAIGNGTASKETELFTAEVISEMQGTPVQYMVVSEAGASVYSASKLAAEEFPDFDVTLRSACLLYTSQSRIPSDLQLLYNALV